MDNEEIKLNIIKQFRDQTPAAKAAMFRGNMSQVKEWSQYESGMWFIAEDIGLEFLVEMVKEECNDIKFQVSFRPLSLNAPNLIQSCLFRGDYVSHIYVETYKINKNNQLVFYLNAFDLIVNDHQFKIINERTANEVVYGLGSGTFKNKKTVNHILSQWDSIRSRPDIFYIEYRHWRLDDVGLRNTLTSQNVNVEIFTKVTDSFGDKWQGHWPECSRMTDIINFLYQ